MRTCTYPGCDRKHRAKGYCLHHYYRDRRGIDMGAPIVSRRSHALVQERDREGRKKCKTCQDWLDPIHFYPGAASDGLSVSCKECHKLQKYNISKTQFWGMLRGQNYGCAICGSLFTDVAQFDIDHDHSCCPDERSCGQCVRELLCNSCNTGIENFGEDTVRLRSAIEYLERHK